MRKFNEVVGIYHPETGELLASCAITVITCWYLYPLVFVTEERYRRGIPGLFSLQGMVNPSLPHDQQKEWYKCFCSWERYKAKMIIPLVANMEYRMQEGHFVDGTTSYNLVNTD